MTIVNLPDSDEQNFETLHYYDGDNIIHVNDLGYFLIAQVDDGKMGLFQICNDMEWNRYTDIVRVDWPSLTTNTIKEYCPLLKGKVIRKVNNIKITFEWDK